MLGDKSNLFSGNRSTNSALGYGICYLWTDLYRKVLADLVPYSIPHLTNCKMHITSTVTGTAED